MEPWFEAGHVAIVTGGSRGLGKAVARELLRRGVFVVIDGRDVATLETARAELSREGRLVAVAGDVTQEYHVRELFAAARDLGGLDLLVNNASTLGAVPMPRIDAAAYEVLRRAFDTNLFAPIRLMQGALEAMSERGGIGTIVNVTSDAGVEAYPTWGVYGASKAALEHVSRVLAEERSGSSIRMLVVDPGDMDTQMHRDAIPDADPGTLRDPADAARALLRAIATMRSPYERVRLDDPVEA